MFLTKRTYVGSKVTKVSVTEDVEHLRYCLYLRKGVTSIFPERISHVIEEVGYWRKANQIHGWFVDNVQNGIDNCQEFEVSLTNLKGLLETCERVRDDHSLAEALLPLRRGFFFGSDEYYFEHIDNTIDIINKVILEDSEQSPTEFVRYFYQSSW